MIDRVPKLGCLAAYAKHAMSDKVIEHKQYITRYDDDTPEVKQRRWPVVSSDTTRWLETGGWHCRCLGEAGIQGDDTGTVRHRHRSRS